MAVDVHTIGKTGEGKSFITKYLTAAVSFKPEASWDGGELTDNVIETKVIPKSNLEDSIQTYNPQDSPGFQDLPPETLIQIFKHLSATEDLPLISHVNHWIKSVADDDEIWKFFAFRDYGAVLRLSTTLSSRLVYQNLLHRFSPVLGLWGRQNLKFYGQVINVYIQDQKEDDENEVQIVFEHWVPPASVNGYVEKETIASFSIDHLGHLALVKKGYLFNKIFEGKLLIQHGSKKLFNERKEMFDSVIRSELESDQLGIFNQDHEETFTDGEAFQKCLGHAVKVWNYDLEDSYLLPRKVADMCREEKSGKGMVFNKINVAQTRNSGFPLSGGLFKGDYGSHGAEFILLDVPETGVKGVRGVKITGDLNVPFSETSFEVVDDRPLIIPEEAQKSLRDLATYMENPQFGDANQDTKETKFDTQGIFGGYSGAENFEVVDKNCLGIWSVDCLVAAVGFKCQEKIPGLLIAYGEDLFGVIFLRMGCIMAFQRITDSQKI